jgi:hypothetical protein
MRHQLSFDLRRDNQPSLSGIRLFRLLKSKGVEFAADPKKESWGTSAIFKDVDGNKFVLGNK